MALGWGITRPLTVRTDIWTEPIKKYTTGDPDSGIGQDDDDR